MRSFKKLLLSAVSFFCVIALLCGATVGLYYHTELVNYMDAGLRRSLAGSVDCLILGSSHAWNGMMPEVLDREMGMNTYNLSGGVLPMYAKILLAEKELKRNPIRLVFIDIAPDTMTRDNAKDYSEGDEQAIARLDSAGERLDYIRRFLSLNDTVNVFSRAILRGVQAWLNLLRGDQGLDAAAKGYYGRNTKDVSIPADELAEVYQSEDVADELAAYRERNIDELAELIALCKEYGAEPVLINIPVSDHELFKKSNWNLFDSWIRGFAEEQGCRYYDFNLLRERYALFSDERSFYDLGHLSRTGAEAFSEAFGGLMARAQAGEDLSDAFYPGYEELLADSPYMQAYTANAA